MDVLVAELQYRVASLETQLTAARYELHSSRETIIHLAKLLAEKQRIVETAPAQLPTELTPQRLAGYPTLQPAVQISTNNEQKLELNASPYKDHADLIDLNTTQYIATEAVKRSSSAEISTEPLSTPLSQPAKKDEGPPMLDLTFRGLRTAHDGPLRASPKSLIPKVSQQVTRFSNTTSYRAATPETVSRSTSLSNDYFRKPLSQFHGIRYQPREDEDLFLNRTRIMIFNLPFDVTVGDVLSKLRGGVVVSCQLLDTKFAYGGLSAMIRFSSYIEAMRCVDYATTSPLVFNNKSASVQLIPTPSYPLAPEIYKHIFEHGHTRCLRIYEFHRLTNWTLREHYTNPKYIEYQATNGCGDWFVRFTSVERASALWADLESAHTTHRNSGFMPDPCDIEDASHKIWKGKEIKIMEMKKLNWKI